MYVVGRSAMNLKTVTYLKSFNPMHGLKSHIRSFAFVASKRKQLHVSMKMFNVKFKKISGFSIILIIHGKENKYINQVR